MRSHTMLISTLGLARTHTGGLSSTREVQPMIRYTMVGSHGALQLEVSRGSCHHPSSQQVLFFPVNSAAS